MRDAFYFRLYYLTISSPQEFEATVFSFDRKYTVMLVLALKLAFSVVEL